MFHSVGSQSKDSASMPPSPSARSQSSLSTASDASLSSIEALSLDVLSASSTELSETSLQGRVSPFSVKGRAIDDPRSDSPRMSIEATHVENWQKSLTVSRQEFTTQMKLEGASIWKRLTHAIIRWFIAHFNPKHLPEKQVQQAFYNIFSDVLEKLNTQTPIQNGLVIEELQAVCSKTISDMGPLTQEEKERWLEYFDTQMRQFLHSHAGEVAGENLGNHEYNNLIGLATSFMAAVRQGLGDEPDSAIQEVLEVDHVYNVRGESCRYVIKADSEVKVCSWDYVLQEGEESFLANNSVLVDIPRDGAQINGKIYFSLKEVVKALKDLGVEGKDIGFFTSVFAQNTPSTILTQATLLYGVIDPEHIERSLMPGRYQSSSSLNIDPKTQSYTLSSHFIGGILSPLAPLKGDRPLFQIGEKRQYDTFVSDVILEGSIGEKKAQCQLQQYHLFSSILEKSHPENTSISSAAAFLSRPIKALASEEMDFLRRLVEPEVKTVEKISRTINHIKNLAKSISGLSVDDMGRPHSVSRGGGRLRSRRSSKAQQIQIALDRLRVLQRSVVDRDGQTLEGKIFSQMEASIRLAREKRAMLTEVEKLTLGDIEKNPENPSYLFATRLLDQYYKEAKR